MFRTMRGLQKHFQNKGVVELGTADFLNVIVYVTPPYAVYCRSLVVART